MRLTHDKIIKQSGITIHRIPDNFTTDQLVKSVWKTDEEYPWEDEKGNCYINNLHTVAIVSYDLDLLFAHDRTTKFTGLMRRLFAIHNWNSLGLKPSKQIMRMIRDAKATPKSYALMFIGESLIDTRYIYDFIKHYQRGDDFIEFYSCGKDKPIVITSNAKEWMCIIAPRTDKYVINAMDSSFPILVANNNNPYTMSDKSYIETVLPAPKFNPITGEFE
jgi:hypothetical protein